MSLLEQLAACMRLRTNIRLFILMKMMKLLEIIMVMIRRFWIKTESKMMVMKMMKKLT